MSFKVADEAIEKIYKEINRKIVNKNFHQGIITINKKDFVNALVNIVYEEVPINEPKQFEFELHSDLETWWSSVKHRLKQGPTARATWEHDVVDKGDVVLFQYAALNPLEAKATQDNVANWVKNVLKKVAAAQGDTVGALLNAHAAEGGGEANFPDDPQGEDVEDIINRGYRDRGPRSKELKDRATKAMKKGGSGAQGTVVSQQIALFLKRWEEWIEASPDTGLYTIRHWFVKNWYLNYFGKARTFEGNWSDKKIDAGLLVQHTIMPNELNSGTLDEAIRGLVEKELQRGALVAAGFLKVIQMLGITKLLDLFAASPHPLDKTVAISKKVLIDSLFPHKTNPNMKLKVNKRLYAEAQKAKTKKGYAKKGTLGKLTAAHLTGKAVRVKRPQKRSSVQKGAAIGMTAQSPIALRNLLNEALPPLVAQKMTSPALRFRTGRFANSTRVENVAFGPRGGLHIDYTYMRDPYETFEPGNKQGSTTRDPRKIIGKSIRELSMQIIGRQPSTLRRN